MPLRYREHPKTPSDRRPKPDPGIRGLLTRLPAPRDVTLTRVSLASGVVLHVRSGKRRIPLRLFITEQGNSAPVAVGSLAVDAPAAPAGPERTKAVAWVVASLRRLRADGELERLRSLIAENGVSAGPEQAEIRLLLACDQRCFFCNCDGRAPNLQKSLPAALGRARRFRRAGATRLTITGGEPTLHAGLLRLIREAKALGFTTIGLQTNSMKLAEAKYAEGLRTAGLDEVFASLHGSSAGTVDRITGLPGGFDRTVAGIRRAIASGLDVTVNFVANRRNLGELPGFVSFVQKRLPGTRGIVLSLMSPVAWALRNLDEMPSLSEAAPLFRASLAEGVRRGLEVRVAGVCGMPLCQLTGFEALADESENPEGVAVSADRRYGTDCAECRYRNRCTGFWTRYLDRRGDAELKPVRA